MRKSISPFIYLFTAIIVCIASVLSLSWWERNVGLRTLWRVGDIDTVLISTSISSILFLVTNLFIRNFEKSPSFTKNDHFRITFFLYPILLLIIVWLPFALPLPSTDAHGYGLAAVLFIVCLIGVAINALFIWWASKRRESS